MDLRTMHDALIRPDRGRTVVVYMYVCIKYYVKNLIYTAPCVMEPQPTAVG